MTDPAYVNQLAFLPPACMESAQSVGSVVLEPAAMGRCF